MDVDTKRLCWHPKLLLVKCTTETQIRVNHFCRLVGRTQIHHLFIVFSKTRTLLAMINLKTQIASLGRYSQFDWGKVLGVGVGLAFAIQGIKICMKDAIQGCITVLIVHRYIWVLWIMDY
jgi:hypothetical protein